MTYLLASGFAERVLATGLHVTFCSVTSPPRRTASREGWLHQPAARSVLPRTGRPRQPSGQGGVALYLVVTFTLPAPLLRVSSTLLAAVS